MCNKIIVLSLIGLLIAISNITLAQDKSEKFLAPTEKEMPAKKEMKVEEKIRLMEERGITGQKEVVSQEQEGVVRAVGKGDIKKKQVQTYHTQKTISEIPVEEAEEVGGDKQVYSNEKVEEIKSKIEEESKILTTEEVKPLEKMPPLTLGEQEEIKFNPSITRVILREGGGADYITTHSGISKKKYLVFEIYSIDSNSKTLQEVISKGEKDFSQQIQTNSDGNFEISYQSNKYQQGNYYLVVSGGNETKGEYKIIHFVRVSPVSTEVIKKNIPTGESVKPIIKFNK